MKPDRVFFALGLIGLGVLFGIFPRLAALLEAGMIGVFTALVWVPLVVGTPTSQLQWTGLLVSWTIAAAAWVVAGSLANKQSSPTLLDDLRRGTHGPT